VRDFDSRGLFEALDAQRVDRGLSWRGVADELARQLRCTASQLTGMRTARFAIDMNLAMKTVQWLQRPAADFIYAAGW
jgi:hypothetical protein